MPIKLSSIKGLMLEKKVTTEAWTFNNAIEKQGAKKIGMNRERLAKTIYEDKRNRFYKLYPNMKEQEFDIWESLLNYQKEPFYESADAIIADEADIIEAQS